MWWKKLFTNIEFLTWKGFSINETKYVDIEFENNISYLDSFFIEVSFVRIYMYITIILKDKTSLYIIFSTKNSNNDHTTDIYIQINIYFDKYKIKNEKFKNSSFNSSQKFIKILIVHSIISNSLKKFPNPVSILI